MLFHGNLFVRRHKMAAIPKLEIAGSAVTPSVLGHEI